VAFERAQAFHRQLRGVLEPYVPENTSDLSMSVPVRTSCDRPRRTVFS
jgi:hypothetical protein